MASEQGGRPSLAWLQANAAAVRTALGLTGGAGDQVDLGTGDGSTLIFNFASTGIVCSLVFVDGIQQDADVWSVNVGSGPAGVDQLVFGSGNAPASGASVEALVSTT